MGGDPLNITDSYSSSMIKLDAEASDGESLDSNVLKVAQEAA